jgi:hypothetical protein
LHYSGKPVGIVIPAHSAAFRVDSAEPSGRVKNRHTVAQVIGLSPVPCHLSLIASFPLLHARTTPIMVSQP